MFQLVKREGTGTELPMIGDTVFVHYVGRFLDGTQFDSSRHRENPFFFELGKGLFHIKPGCKVPLSTVILTILPCAQVK